MHQATEAHVRKKMLLDLYGGRILPVSPSELRDGPL